MLPRSCHYDSTASATVPCASVAGLGIGISQLAGEFGLTARALRFYEDLGLITPQRQGTMRRYGARDRARLELVLRGKRVGMALCDIKQILDLYDLGDGQHAQMRATRADLLDQAAALRAQRIDLDATLAEIAKGLDWIEQRLASPKLALVDSETAKAYDAQARKSLDMS